MRYCLLYEFQLGHSAAEAHRNMTVVFGKDCYSESHCRSYFTRFRNGNFSLENEPHSAILKSWGNGYHTDSVPIKKSNEVTYVHLWSRAAAVSTGLRLLSLEMRSGYSMLTIRASASGLLQVKRQYLNRKLIFTPNLVGLKRNHLAWDSPDRYHNYRWTILYSTTKSGPRTQNKTARTTKSFASSWQR